MKVSAPGAGITRREPSRKKTLWLGCAELFSGGVNPEVNVYLLDFFVSWSHVSMPKPRVAL